MKPGYISPENNAINGSVTVYLKFETANVEILHRYFGVILVELQLTPDDWRVGVPHILTVDHPESQALPHEYRRERGNSPGCTFTI